MVTGHCPGRVVADSRGAEDWSLKSEEKRTAEQRTVELENWRKKLKRKETFDSRRAESERQTDRRVRVRRLRVRKWGLTKWRLTSDDDENVEAWYEDWRGAVVGPQNVCPPLLRRPGFRLVRRRADRRQLQRHSKKKNKNKTKAKRRIVCWCWHYWIEKVETRKLKVETKVETSFQNVFKSFSNSNFKFFCQIFCFQFSHFGILISKIWFLISISASEFRVYTHNLQLISGNFNILEESYIFFVSNSILDLFDYG